MVDVVLFGEEAIDVYTQRATAVQDGCRKPRFTAALDYLLDLLLNLIRSGRMPKTTHRGFDFTDTFEIGKRIDSAGEVLRERDVALDRFRVAFPAHKLHRHP